MARTKEIKKRNLAAIILFGLIFSLSYIWQAIVPVGSEAPDEGQHIQVIYFLKNNQRIPVFDQEKAVFKTFFFKIIDDRHYGGVYYPMTYNSPLSYLPYIPLAQNNTDLGGKGVVLPMRLISGLFTGLFAVFLFLALFNLNQRKLFSALGLALFISLIPQVIYTSAYVNIEPIALFLSALSLYFLSLIFLQSKPKNYLYLGISLGLLALCKANYLIVVLYLGIIALALLLHSATAARQKTINFVLISAPIIALNSWWWIRNIRLYRDPIIINHISSTISNASPSWFLTASEAGASFFGIFRFVEFRQNTFFGFYAYFGAMSIPLPTFVYQIFYISLIVTVLVGLYFIIKKNRRDLPPFLFSIFIILLGFALFINKNLTDFSPQGRHLFPLLIPLSVILILALKNWPGKLKKYFLSAIVVLSFIANFFALLYLVSGYYITGRGWMIEPFWQEKIAWVFTFSTNRADKIVSDFTFHNFTLGNYKKLYSAVYFGNPAYSIYLLAIFALSFLIFTVVILRVLFLNRSKG